MGTRSINPLAFPTRYMYGGANFANRVHPFLQGAIPHWQSSGLLQRGDSFGLAIANRKYASNFRAVWNNPEELVGCVLGWGPERSRYIANAMRMMRAAARLGQNTLEIVESSRSSLFRDVVESQPNDKTSLYPWGDYPRGGAAFSDDEDTAWLVSVDGLAQAENNMVAISVGNFLRVEAQKVDKCNARR